MANNNIIKGITIEVNGETKGLSQALREVNKDITTTSKYLKEVEKGLQMDPGNAELIAKKQELLTDAIDETKKKLDLLKQASEKANEQLAAGEISKQQYEELQIQIQKTENDLTKLESTAQHTQAAMEDVPKAGSGSFQDFGVKLGDVGSKVEDVGAKLTALSGIAVAAGGACLAAFTDVDQAADNLIIKTGASGAQLEDLENVMNSLAKKMPEDLGTISDAVGEVNTRFGLTGDELEKTAEDFIKFSSLNGSDVSGSIDQVQKTMAAFGVSTEDTAFMLDTLNRVGQDTGISVDKLASDMQSNAEAFTELGMNASDAAIFIGQIEKSGADVSVVMAGMKKALTNASKNGHSLNYEMEMLNDTLKGSASYQEKYNAAVEVFGSKGAAQIINGVKEGTLSLEAMNTTLYDSAGSVDQTYAATLDGIDNMKIATNELKMAAGEVGETLSDQLGPAIIELADLLGEFSDWLKTEEGSTFTDTIVIIGEIIAVLGPLLLVIGKIIGVVAKGIEIWGTIGPWVTGTLIPALTTAGGTIAELIPPIAAVIAVIAAIILWIKNWNSIVEVAIMFLTDFKTSWQYLSDWIYESGQFFLDPVFDVLANLQIMFEDLVANAKQWAIDMIANFVSGMKEKGGILAEAAEGVAKVVSTFLHFSVPDKGPLADADKFMPDMIDLFAETLNSSRHRLDGALTNVGNQITGAITPDYSQALSGISGQLGGIAAAGTGEIIVPIYIGNEMLDEVVVNATARNNYRNGGR